MKKKNAAGAARTKHTDSLELLLADKPDDEKGGVNASAGITYQQWWATLKATELYAEGGDFAIGMEVKEDVAVLDSLDAPTKAEFYQVKKYEREGAWSWSDLVRAPTKKDGISVPSALAKLYARRHSFSGYSTKLTFISNMGFKVPLEDGGKGLQHSTGCGLHEFIESKATEVRNKLAEQLGILAADVALSDFYLSRTSLPLAEQDTFVTGKLSTLSDTGKLPFKISRPHISARMLAAEFQQRGGSTDYANTFDKLKLRCLTKTEITRVLQNVEASGPTIESAINASLERLDREGFHYGKHEAINREKVFLCAHLCDRTNGQIFRLCNLFFRVKKESQAELDSMSTLGTMMEYLVKRASEQDPSQVKGLSVGYLNGLALLVIKNAINVDIFIAASSTQSKDQQ
jgi:hypothetical protein